jgi:hypothetical protein
MRLGKTTMASVAHGRGLGYGRTHHAHRPRIKGADRSGASAMQMWISSQVGLEEPSAWGGLLTWLDIQIGDEDERERRSICGHARVAIVHAGVDGATMWEVLDEESAELEALYERYFDGGWVKEAFGIGGVDLMYIEELTIDAAHRGRNIELAVVRRLCDTIGRGCAIAVVPYESNADVEFWQKMGFKVTEPRAMPGTMHMESAFVQPRVRGPNATGHFWAVVNGTGGRHRERESQ